MAGKHEQSSQPGLTELELSYTNTDIYDKLQVRPADAHTYTDLGTTANTSGAGTKGQPSEASPTGRALILVAFGVLFFSALFSAITGFVVYQITNSEIDNRIQALDSQDSNSATGESSSLDALANDLKILKTKLPPLNEEWTLHDEIAELEHIVSRNHSDIAASLDALDHHLNELEDIASSNHSETLSYLNTLEGMTKELQEKQNASGDHLAFTVHTPTGELIDGVPTFEHVVLNMGSAYNQDTGLFVSPRAGVYLFSFSLMTMSSISEQVWCSLYRNESLLLGSAYSQIGQHNAATVTVVIHMSAGDYLGLITRNWKQANKTHQTLYMGVLINAD